MNTNLDAMISHAYEYAAKTILGKTNQVIPLFLLLLPDNEVEVIACPWQNMAEKKAAAAYTRLRIAITDAVAYSFITEVWLVGIKKTDPLPDLPPSEHPARKEAVMALAVTPTEKKMVTWDIVRDTQGRCCALSTSDSNAPIESFSSWLANLF